MGNQIPENVPIPLQILIQPIHVGTIRCWTLPSCHKSHFFLMHLEQHQFHYNIQEEEES